MLHDSCKGGHEHAVNRYMIFRISIQQQKLCSCICMEGHLQSESAGCRLQSVLGSACPDLQKIMLRRYKPVCSIMICKFKQMALADAGVGAYKAETAKPWAAGLSGSSRERKLLLAGKFLPGDRTNQSSSAAPYSFIARNLPASRLFCPLSLELVNFCHIRRHGVLPK